ncbi:Nucleotide-binding universal stress protein, UspA family [Halopelagius inordinatus]|uniref:Nucleotide-binding universal stress protein, UspA family n=1 Tax=Halopelagius inordinatus TaxID=553467 RepID=A0A1I2NTN3_9EURY|nr:universal stress protein [Halopelagius inordinatus]SFG06370.1 Nucleotide-binding universal stress protein, UspA family [Halopelagius inordinatus]
MYDRILVPTDGSDPANNAVDHAIDLARQHGAELHALSVVDARHVGVGAPAVTPEEVQAAIEERSETATARVRDRAAVEDVDVVTAVRNGSPSDEIRSYADEEDCDLVVMGTHGRTSVERYLLGSVTERVLRRGDTPVLAVRGDD